MLKGTLINWRSVARTKLDGGGFLRKIRITLVLNFGLHIFNGVSGLNLEGNGLASHRWLLCRIGISFKSLRSNDCLMRETQKVIAPKFVFLYFLRYKFISEKRR